MLHPNKEKNKGVKSLKQLAQKLNGGGERRGRQEAGIQNRMQSRVTIYQCDIIQISFKRIAIHFQKSAT